MDSLNSVTSVSGSSNPSSLMERADSLSSVSSAPGDGAGSATSLFESGSGSSETSQGSLLARVFLYRVVVLGVCIETTDLLGFQDPRFLSWRWVQDKATQFRHYLVPPTFLPFSSSLSHGSTDSLVTFSFFSSCFVCFGFGLEFSGSLGDAGSQSSEISSNPNSLTSLFSSFGSLPSSLLQVETTTSTHGSDPTSISSSSTSSSGGGEAGATGGAGSEASLYDSGLEGADGSSGTSISSIGSFRESCLFFVQNSKKEKKKLEKF